MKKPADLLVALEVDTPIAMQAPNSLAPFSLKSQSAVFPSSQVAAVIRDTTDATDIAFSPEELGRVSLKLDRTGDGLVVHIIAERPETADLIRRNLSDLGQELEAIGFQNVDFSFDQQKENQSRSEMRPDIYEMETTEGDVVGEQKCVVRLGLDLRV